MLLSYPVSAVRGFVTSHYSPCRPHRTGLKVGGHPSVTVFAILAFPAAPGNGSGEQVLHSSVWIQLS